MLFVNDVWLWCDLFGEDFVGKVFIVDRDESYKDFFMDERVRWFSCVLGFFIVVDFNFFGKVCFWECFDECISLCDGGEFVVFLGEFDYG